MLILENIEQKKKYYGNQTSGHVRALLKSVTKDKKTEYESKKLMIIPSFHSRFPLVQQLINFDCRQVYLQCPNE